MWVSSKFLFRIGQQYTKNQTHSCFNIIIIIIIIIITIYAFLYLYTDQLLYKSCTMTYSSNVFLQPGNCCDMNFSGTLSW